MVNRKDLLKLGLYAAGLAIIIYLAIQTRMSTYNTPTVLDYDPFWFYRHAEAIVNNGYKVPQWDLR